MITVASGSLFNGLGSEKCERSRIMDLTPCTWYNALTPILLFRRRLGDRRSGQRRQRQAATA